MKSAHGVIVVGAGLLFSAAAGIAVAEPVLTGGNFDSIPIGTPPDVGSPGGPWGFPQNYVNAGLAETAASQYTIAATSDFDPGSPGHSLRFNAQGASDLHMRAMFDKPVTEETGQKIVLSFDIWVRSLDTSGFTWGGGSVYLSGDHGGGGYHADTDRGPQISWGSNGRISVRSKLENGGVEEITLSDTTPRDRWQSLRLEVDLNTDRFDVYWGLKGDAQVQIGDELFFRSGPSTWFDRINIARFVNTTKFPDAYYDNFSVDVVPTPGSLLLLATGLASTGRRRRT
ncbi:MAG: PEP-CTERM sorting domain-containing protein [Phycisphaerales bacterium]|nr:PEP-CTERM sorting domain-containing protein [Phycisphaerales bacterium]